MKAHQFAFVCFLLLVSAAISPIAAYANPVSPPEYASGSVVFNYTFTGTSSNTIGFVETFSVASMPIPIFSIPNDLFEIYALDYLPVSIDGVIDPNPGSYLLTFVDPASTQNPGVDFGNFFTYGPALFTGTTLSPTMNAGTFDLTSNGSQSFQLVVTDTGVPVTPEPSSLVLLGTGMVGVAAAVRRRFRKN